MKQALSLTLVVVVVAMVGGCATGARPQVKTGLITPADLKPGESAVITVELQDKYKVVKRLEGTVVQNPDIAFELRDDGAAPGDEKADDGIWSLKVDVPFQAPPGDYQLDLTAYNDKGDKVMVRDKDGNTVPLTVSIPVRIQLPQ